MSDSDSEGRAFESHQAYQSRTSTRESRSGFLLFYGFVLKNSMKLIHFLHTYKDDLLDIGPQKSFYTHDANRIAQKYVAELPNMVLSKLLDFIEKAGNHVFDEAEYSDETDNLEN